MLTRFGMAMLLTVIVSGCSTYDATRYSVSVDNVMALKALNDAKLNVGEFTSSEPDKTEIMCRAVGPIKAPDGKTFENFIRKGFVDELKLAEVYSASSPVTLTGNLDNIDFSSVAGTWDIGLTITSSNGKTLSVSEHYSYTTNFVAEFACQQTAQALMPAVQDLIGKVVHDAEFYQLTQ